MALKSIENKITTIFDALKPELFSSLVSAAKIISGFDIETKCFKAPSLALHMGTNLKILCDVALKVVIENKNIPNITWDDKQGKKMEIKELSKLISGHWCNELSSLALKNLKEKQWGKPTELSLTSDISALQTYCNNMIV
ncbi:hypothetical protein BDFB_014611 [Asbolus verrucosus]|uniref:Uncharacterized protein n=1 Tax=Asbolus verrucosus TaxID=1661398 RepID=A0A482VFW0_ASBVE|nr:hypothetical protein BDFB_014611 [Asbolus verrucosus]